MHLLRSYALALPARMRAYRGGQVHALKRPRSGRAWEIICQDALGSKGAVEHAVAEAVRAGRRVVVDRCNVRVADRKRILDVAMQPADAVCVHLATGEGILQQARVHTHRQHLREGSILNTHTRHTHTGCPAVACLAEESDRLLAYTLWVPYIYRKERSSGRGVFIS